MPVGQSTETQEVQAVTQQMSLDISIDDFAVHREALVLQLAAQYRVHPSLITLEATAGSLQLTVTIATSDGSGNAVQLEAITQVTN